MPIYNDGPSSGFQVGSRTLSINSVTYVAESFDYNEGTSKTEEVFGETGNPTGSVSWASVPKGTATLQLSGTQAIPTQGLNFVTTIRGTNTNFTITDVGTPEGQQDRKKVNISYIKLIN